MVRSDSKRFCMIRMQTILCTVREIGIVTRVMPTLLQSANN